MNNLDNYPISNLKIDEILKNDKNYIGTYSKDNVPLLKNNQSTIINVQNPNKSGSHWVSYKKIGRKIFYFDSYGVGFIPDIITKQYPSHKFICNIYRIQSMDSIQCGRFCILFIKSNIKNENDYNNFLLQFEKNNFLKNDIQLYIMYCLKCKKDTKDLNVKAFMTKNNRYMLKSTCNIC